VRLSKHEVEETKLRAIFASSPDAITVIDLNGNIMECNQATLDLLGYSSKDDVIGKNGFALVAKKDRERAKENLKKVLEQGSMKNVEYTALTKDGREFLVGLSVSVIKDSSGNPTGFVAITKEITERKRTEKALQESEEKFRSIFESANDCMIYLDIYGKILDVNEKTVEVFGGSKKELLGKHFTRLGVISSRDIPTLLSAFAKVLAGKQATLNLHIRNKKGQEIPLECSGSLMKTDDKLTVLVIARDVAERKKAEEALRESEEKYRSLVTHIPDVTWTTDREGNIIFISPNIETVSGYTPEEYYKGGDRFWFGRIHPDDVENVKEAYKSLVEKGTRFDIEYRIKRKDGEWIWGHDRAVTTYEKDGVLYADGIFSDITERKQMEEALRESEERFRNLFESIQDPVGVYVGREGRLVDHNKTFNKLSGYTDEELKDKTFLDFVHPDDQAMVLERYRTRYPEEELPLVYEIRAVNKKGETIPIEISVSTYKVKGKVIGIEVIHRDITERKKAEEALRESERKYRNLFENARDLILTIDLEGNVTSANSVLLEYGYDKSEVIGKNVFDIIPEEYWQQFGDQFGELARGKPIEGELKIKDRRRQGYTVAEYKSNPIIQDNKVVGVQTIVRDITERKQMEEKLRQYSEHLEELVQKRTEELLESEKRYSVVVEEASDGVVILQDEKIVFANKKAAEVIGYSRDELEGLPLEKLVDEKYLPLAKEMYERSLRGDVSITFEVEWRAKNGERIPIEISGARIYYQGRPAVLRVARDIRERKRMEEERLKLEKLATIGELATMVGHDLRNPLQAIENATYYLNNELPRLPPSTPIPQKAIEMLQIINDSVNYADKIVRDLHDFSATKKPVFKKTNINTIVKETLSQVEAPENVELITELGHLPEIKVDMDQIKRVFLNLTINGIQAIEKGGTLKVSTKKTKEFVEVKFEDTGVGIPKENMKKIFTPFFTTRAKGMGMGLPICKKFVEIHGGSIEVESEEGKGSTFTVKLPIQQRMEVKTGEEDG